jgi:hypothetical protein
MMFISNNMASDVGGFMAGASKGWGSMFFFPFSSGEGGRGAEPAMSTFYAMELKSRENE